MLSQSLTFTGTGGQVTLNVDDNGVPVGSSNTFQVDPGPASLTQSLVTVTDDSIQAGNSTTITLQAVDAYGNNETSGGLMVAFQLGSSGSSGVSSGTIDPVIDNGDGTYTATFTGIDAGTANTITATIGTQPVTSAPAPITVMPAVVSTAYSVVTLTQDGVAVTSLAAGSTATITLLARNSSDNAIPDGLNVRFRLESSGSGGSSGIISNVTDDGNGTYTATFTATTAGTLNGIIATIGGADMPSSPSITVTPGALAKFKFAALTDQTAGTPFSLNITAEDAYGNTVTSFSGSVTITASGATLGTIDYGTFSNGTLSQTLMFTGTGGHVQLTVSGGGATSTTSAFQVNPGVLEQFIFVPIDPEATGEAFTTTITAADSYGNTITSFSGPVTLTASGAALQGTPVTSGTFIDGMLTQSLTFTGPGSSVTLTASSGGTSSDSNTFEVGVGLASVAESVVSVSQTSITAGDTMTVTLQARDAYGNDETSGGLNVAFDLGAGSGFGTFTGVTDNGNGTYTATFTGQLVGSGRTITATIGGQSVTSVLPTIAITPGAVDLGQSQLTVSAARITAGSTATITLVAEDAYGNLETGGGLSVAFGLGTGGSSGTIGSVVDQANGTYSATFTGMTAGTPSTITASIGVSAVTSPLPTITVTPGALSLAESVVTISAASIAAGDKATLTLHAKDSYGNNETGGGLVVVFGLGSSGTSSGTLSAVRDDGNGTYTATLTGITAGTANNITATIGGNSVTSVLPTVTVRPGVVSEKDSVLTVVSNTVAAGTTTTITLQAKDSYGNEETSGGLLVSFALGSTGTSSGTISTITDDHDGTYTATFTGTIAGTAQDITAIINDHAVTSRPTVTVVPGVVSLSESLVSVGAINDRCRRRHNHHIASPRRLW